MSPSPSSRGQSCAFVQYTYRANAEFAKEAMSNQTLLSREQAASFRGDGLLLYGIYEDVVAFVVVVIVVVVVGWLLLLVVGVV